MDKLSLAHTEYMRCRSFRYCTAVNGIISELNSYLEILGIAPNATFYYSEITDESKPVSKPSKQPLTC